MPVSGWSEAEGGRPVPIP